MSVTLRRAQFGSAIPVRAKPGGPESYNSRSISSLATTEDMSANCGRVAIGPNTNINGGKIEGSFIIPLNETVAIPDVDVSYVDGYTVPITCSSQGITVTGCNTDLFKQSTCEIQVDGPVCLNPAVSLPNGPPTGVFCSLCRLHIHIPPTTWLMPIIEQATRFRVA